MKKLGTIARCNRAFQLIRWLVFAALLLPIRQLSAQDPVYGALAAGGNHDLACLTNGFPLAAGRNESGQLGSAYLTNRAYFDRIAGLSNVIALEGGDSHSLALLANGSVYSWGTNQSGQLGLGDTTSRTTPTQITNLSNIIAIAAGSTHSLALASNGNVYAFGEGTYGRLGTGDTGDRTSPVQVTSLSGVSAIAAGGSHSMAISNGIVFCFGNGGNGRLGNGSTGNKTTPYPATGLSNITAIAAGGQFSLALRSDQTVWAFGLNTSGQLGDSTTTQRLTPVQVTNLNGVAAIAAGDKHSLALLTNGLLRAWGANSSGQIGDNSTSTRKINVAVVGISNVMALAAGDLHSAALTADGKIYCWGDRANSQLADLSTNSYSKVPVPTVTAIQIEAQPQNQTVIFGNTANFNVNAIGTTPLGYQWRLNGTSLATATTSALAIENAQPADEGSYTVLLTNAPGSATSSVATLTVLVPAAIFTQPTNQTVAQGNNATFNVSAIGTSPLSYQWRFDGSNLPGATAASYLRPTVQPSDAGSYSVVVTNLVGSDTSSNAVLTVIVPPSITRQPESIMVPLGCTAAFKVTATSDIPLSYQWRCNGTNLPGETNALVLVVTDPATACNYSVAVSNAAGVVVSASAALSCYSYTGDAPPPLPEGTPLDHWPFDDTNWLTVRHRAPLLATNLDCVASWDAQALQLDSTNAAWLQYPVVWTNASDRVFTKLVCDRGSLEFWFKPNWSGTNLGGTGPGTAAPLIEIGQWTTNASNGWWSLYLNPEGTALHFSAQAEGVTADYLTAGITWLSNEWYHVALTYSATNSVLYLDGHLAASGSGVTVLPSEEARADGFRIGSDSTGLLQARGQFENLTTYNYPLTDNEVTCKFAVAWPVVAVWQAEGGESGQMAQPGTSPPGSGPSGPQAPEGPAPCGTNSLQDVRLVNMVSTNIEGQGWTVSFTIAGGTTGATYYVFATTNLVAPQWTWITNGSACDTITLTNQPESGAFYMVSFDSDGDGMPDWWEVAHGLNPTDPNDAVLDPDDDGSTNFEEFKHGTNPFDAMVIAWGDNASRQGTIGTSIESLAALACGGGGPAGGHTLALANGAVIAWGATNYGQVNVPSGLNNVVAVAAGGDQSAALKADGTVTSWGRSFDTSPSTLTDVRAIALGYQHGLALRTNGTVATWGRTNSPAYGAPSGLNGVVAIAAGWNHNLALRNDGTVVAWGLTNTARLGWNLTDVPPELTIATNPHAIAIAAGALHSVVLRSDGTVVAWGITNGGVTDVPAGLSDVTAIAAGRGYSLALHQTGTVTGWGSGLPAVPLGLNQIKTIAAGPGHALAVRQGTLTPIIVKQPQTQGQGIGGTAAFEVSALSRSNPSYTWQFRAGTTGDWTSVPGGTSSNLVISSLQSSNFGWYRVQVANGAGTSQSAEAQLGLVTPPVILSPVVPQTVILPANTNYVLSVVVTNQGSEFASFDYQWYHDGTNETMPPSGSNLMLTPPTTLKEGHHWLVVSNVAGSATSAVWTVSFPGSVAAWGVDNLGQTDRPLNATNIIALAAGDAHAVAVREDGSVVQWGYNWGSVPADLTNAVGVAAGNWHTLALRDNGVVTAWGQYGGSVTNVPGGLTNVIAISAGGNQSLALRLDSTVVAWGDNSYGQTNGAASLSNVIAIASGAEFHLALKDTGLVTAWGANDYGQTNVPATLSNVVAIAAAGEHALALRQNGTVGAWGANDFGQSDVPEGLSNVMAIAAGWNHSLALKNDGTTVAWGNNADGQTNVIINLVPIKLIAAGSEFTLASAFSPLLQYPVDVSKDLLLIYNTNSLDSSNVCAYYLAHRPMVSGANVLRLGCPTNESIDVVALTNDILTPVSGWLTANPTKRPQYLILFPDIPSRTYNTVGTNTYATNSVSVTLATHRQGTAPFVTAINMNGTNDCIAYINKLAWCSSNYSPGKLILSASSSGAYGNTNFVLDNVRHGPGYAFPEQNYSNEGATIANATNGILAAGRSDIAITYQDGIETNGASSLPPHITNATNVAGYMCWGFHSELHGDYALSGLVRWTGDSKWYIIETIESSNGQRASGQGTFLQWFSPNAFGGTNYADTPVGAVTQVDEPKLAGVNNSSTYFGLWAGGKNFAICAWNSRKIVPFWPSTLQAVGDPFVTR